jgi:DNA-binding CsgD family transcriptional regulator
LTVDRGWLGRTANEVFVGRREELAVLEAARRDAVAGVPRLVLVGGPPGIGKSALLRAFIAGCGDLTIRRASGDEAEKTLDYGLLDQLVATRWAGEDPAAGTDPLTVGSRLLAALTSSITAAGLALVVDDVHWADVPSLQALTFALRRLRDDPVVTVLGCRDEFVARLPASLGRLIADEGQQLTLSGLSDDALVSLAEALGRGRLSPLASRRLGRHTAGNPLHAAALLQELDAEALERRPGASLPAPRSFAHLVTARLAGCSPDTRELVNAMAVLGLHCRLGPAAAVAGVDDPVGCIDEAVGARLVTSSAPGDEVAFDHWLTRAAVYFDLSPGHRAKLHARAARVVAAEDAVLHHRVAAGAAGDDELAREAADIGRRRAATGAWAAAADALTAAGRLAPSPEERERFRLEAVECLMMLGDVAEAVAHLPDVDEYGPSARRDFVLGHVAVFSGAADEAERRLRSAWESRDRESDGGLAARIATDFAHLAVNRGRGKDTVLWARRALEATEQLASADCVTTLCLGLGVLGQFEEGLAAAAAVPETVVELDARRLDTLVGRGVLLLWTDELAAARRELARAELGLRRHGPLHMRLIALFYLADAEYRIGAWADAVVHSQTGVSLARDADQRWLMALLHSVAAFPLASQGHWAMAETHVEAAWDATGKLGDGSSLLWSAVAGARLAQARGDGAAMVRSLRPLYDIIGVTNRIGTGIQPWQSLWAEGLIATGRQREAEEVMATMAAALEERPHPSALVRLARLRGTLALSQKRLPDADAALSEGAGIDPERRSPFETALLLATHGTVLRRLGRRRAALASLGAASELLAELGAGPFLERCQREQAACGQAPKRRQEPARKLTPQEQTVATLVASGMTNREVADELILSVKTVEYHLRNIFVKLGVSSRGRLAAQLRPDAYGPRSVPGPGSL